MKRRKRPTWLSSRTITFMARWGTADLKRDDAVKSLQSEFPGMTERQARRSWRWAKRQR